LTVFIVGLVIGPVIGILLGDYLFRPGGPRRWQSLCALALLIVFLLFAPFFTLELKIALILGVLVGTLLSATPMSVYGDADPV
jgi:MFS family permease